VSPRDALSSVTLSVPEASRLLGVSRGFGYELARSGRLPGVRKLGSRYLVVTSELKAYLGLDPSSQ
jgi:excisionase family DNA binding protein